MPEPLRLLPLLLVPVVALLFLTLRLSRKLRYPHDLLRLEARRGMASFLFRSFRTYYDVLLDGAIALVLAFALSPPERSRPTAVVLDGSRSMTAGFPGDQPLEKALRRLQADPLLKDADPFLLVFDPKSARTRLAPIRQHLVEGDIASSVRHLREAYDFFAPDYGRLGELRQRGYGAITLLTDQLRVRPEGFQAIESGMAVNFAAYPSGVRFDRASDAWLVTLAEAGHHVPLVISVWNQAEDRFQRLPLDRYAIEEGVAGRIVRFPAPGLYLLALRGPFGLDDIDLPILLGPRQVAVKAAGPFSERMLAVFPNIDRTASAAIVLADQGVKAPPGRRRVTTALVPGNGDQVLNPATTGGALIASGAMGGSLLPDLVLGPSSLDNEDLVLVYDSILAQQEPPFLLQSSKGPLLPVGTAYLTETGRPLLPPPSQFFESRPGPRLLLPPPASRRWPWVVLLGLLATVKLLVWSRLSGKSLLARD
jgi:hypothetical protein